PDERAPILLALSARKSRAVMVPRRPGIFHSGRVLHALAFALGAVCLPSGMHAGGLSVNPAGTAHEVAPPPRMMAAHAGSGRAAPAPLGASGNPTVMVTITSPTSSDYWEGGAAPGAVATSHPVSWDAPGAASVALYYQPSLTEPWARISFNQTT